MRCLAILGAAALLACSSFGEEPRNDGDASAPASRGLRFRIEPSLIVLEAGGFANATLIVEERPPDSSTSFDIAVTGLPEGVKQVAPTKVTYETSEFVLRLEAARDAEGLAFPVKVTSGEAQASFDVRTITKSAPVLDTTYGTNGRAFTGGGLAADDARGLVVQPDGKVIIAGGHSTGYLRVPAIARFNTNGTLDPTFGDGGIVLLEDHSNSFALDVALQADGKILVLEAFDFSVTRLTAAGKVDAQFGTGGITFASFAQESAGAAMAVQPDGKIVVGGRAGTDLGIARYTTTGALDTSFNTTGRATASIANADAEVTAIALAPNGSIFATGWAITATQAQIALARFDPTGALGGTTTYATNASGNDDARAIAISGANVLVGGWHRDALYPDRGFVARFGSNLVFDAAFDAGYINIESLAVSANGSIFAGGHNAGKLAVARLTSGGALDGTFSTTIGDVSFARRIALDASGKIIAAGTKRVAKDPDVVIARYSDTGVLDPTWGTSGIVAMPFGPGDDGVRAAALASDGKLVIAGYAYNGTDFDFLVARFLPDGKLDPSFGGGKGRIFYDRGATSQFAYGVALQPSGDILVSGQGGPGTVVIRLKSDGSLDPTFGDQGAAVISAGDAFGLAVRDGKATLAGAAPLRGFFATRLTESGQLDPSFGQGGSITTQFEDDARGVAFTLDPSGKLIIAGHVDFKKPPNFFDLAVARFDSSGALDTTFDGDGKTTINTSDVELFYTAALQSDGKLLVAGRATLPNQASSLAVFRLDGSGALDTSFGNNGRANVNAGPGSQASALVVQPNGTILVAGRASDGGAILSLLTEKGASVWPNGFLLTAMPVGGEAFSVVRENEGRIIAAGYERVGPHEDGVVLRYRR